MSKQCRECNKHFELEEFNWQNKKKGIKRPYCKYCDRKRAKNHYLDNRDHKLQLMKEWAKRTGYQAPGSYKHNAIPGVYGMFKDGVCYYVGSSKNVYRRRSSWKVKNTHMNLDMNQYVWGIIEECDNYREREQHYISVYQPELNTNSKNK